VLEWRARDQRQAHANFVTRSHLRRTLAGVAVFTPHRGRLREDLEGARELRTRDDLARHLGPCWRLATVDAFDGLYLVTARHVSDGAIYVVGTTSGPLED
jgi:hypothetical protein